MASPEIRFHRPAASSTSFTLSIVSASQIPATRKNAAKPICRSGTKRGVIRRVKRMIGAVMVWITR